MTSAYPKPLDELITQAQQLARELGAIPSQNKLKAALHVRSERARTVLGALRETGFSPTEPDPEPVAERRLHVVPDASDPIGTESVNTGPAEFTGVCGTLPLDAHASSPQPVPTDDSRPAPEQVSDIPEPAPSLAPAPRWTSPARNWLRSVLPSGTGTVEPVAPTRTARPVRGWPVVLLAAPAFVAIWSGWVGLGALTGFGLVHPLPGIADGFTLNSAITLPIGVETYAAYALRVWLATGIGTDNRARRFAKWSAIGALVLGAGGQVAYHLMTADHVVTAPWEITTAVSCLPVIVLGFGAALHHLQHRDRTEVGR